MLQIVHRIKLKDGVTAEQFERWVEEKDYVAAPQMPSLTGFAVHRVADPEAAGCDYFEVIGITSMAAFEQDMATDLFASLVEAFDAMAEVVDELSGERLGAGFHR